MTSAKSLPVAIAQFTVAEEPERNLEIIDGFARDAAAGGAKLLALPEGLIARRGDAIHMLPRTRNHWTGRL